MIKKCLTFVPLMAVIIMLAAPQLFSAINEEEVRARLISTNDQLALAGENFRIEKVDLQTHDDAGPTVYANNRTHQLNSHWVPFDPNRSGTRDITWLVDQIDPTLDVPWADALGAIDRAMELWNTVPCATIPLVQLPDYGMDWGYIQWVYGFGGIPGWYADITHAGWLPREFFDAIAPPDGGDYILGATFTLIWVDSNGDPTDMDGNGKYDVAFKEIYYNDNYDWGIDIRYFDIETVVAHEVGHGVSLGHFGKIFRTPNGELHFAPRALMNAIYYDILHELLGTDNASFCSIWAKWPNH